MFVEFCEEIGFELGKEQQLFLLMTNYKLRDQYLCKNTLNSKSYFNFREFSYFILIYFLFVILPHFLFYINLLLFLFIFTLKFGFYLSLFLFVILQHFLILY